MQITIVIRTEAPTTAAAQELYDAIAAKLQSIPNLKMTGKLAEELVKPNLPDPPE